MSNKATVAISADFLNAYAALPRQKQGKVTEFFNKFRNDPTHPGINFEKINEEYCLWCTIRKTGFRYKNHHQQEYD